MKTALGYKLIWDRCYDFLNIFAKKISKKWRFLIKTKPNFEKM
jgi:hypothetical protein